MNANHTKTADVSTAYLVRRRDWIICHDREREQKNAIAERAGLRNVHITVQLAAISNAHVPLNIAKRSNRAMHANDRMLSDRHSMAGRKAGTNGASSVNNGMTSDE